MKKAKLKENPLMSDNKKIKKLKGSKFDSSSEEEVNLKKFFIIVLVIAVLIGGIYFATDFVTKNKKETENSNINTGNINYDIVSVGTILNRPYDNYYVLIYDASNDNSIKYSTLLSLYNEKHSDSDDLIKVYTCDLSNKLNSKYYNVNNDNISNPKATKIDDFDFGEITLLQVKEGKIKQYIEDYEKIKDILK